MYALQSGKLIPPDPALRSIMDPLAYPGVDGSNEMGSRDARRRGIFNPHYLFPSIVTDPLGGYKRGGEDPFSLGEEQNYPDGFRIPDLSRFKVPLAP